MRSSRRIPRSTTRGTTRRRSSGTPGWATALLETKATADEVDGYRQFVLTLADRVAAAHREGGQDVSPAETEAIQQIAAALGTAVA